jgi:hypothetical protein
MGEVTVQFDDGGRKVAGQRQSQYRWCEPA